MLALLCPEMKFLIVLSQLTVEGWGATSVLADPNSVLPPAVQAVPVEAVEEKISTWPSATRVQMPMQTHEHSVARKKCA